MEKEFSLHDVVWARARNPKSEIFWPAQVVESTHTPNRSKRVIASVKFLGENTYEDVKNPNDMKKWDCEEQQTFLQQGRKSSRDSNQKILFNKGIKEAKELIVKHTKENSAKTPEKIPQDDQNGQSEDCQATKANKQNKSCKEIKFIDDNAIENTSIEGNNCHKQDSTSKVKTSVVSGKQTRSPKKGCISESKSSKEHLSQSGTKQGLNQKRNQSQKASTGKVSNSTKESPLTRSNSLDPKHKSRTTSKRMGSGTEYPSTKRRRKSAEDRNNTVVHDKGIDTKRKRNKDIYGLKSNAAKNGLSPAHGRSKKVAETESSSNVRTNKKLKRQPKKSTQTEAESGCDKGGKVALENSQNIGVNTVQSSSNDGVNTVQSSSNDAIDDWDSDESSDRDLMETALSPSHSDMKFELNDVVWAKINRDPYWPAQIKRINKKPKRIYVQFLGVDLKRSFSCKKIMSFACDAIKREELIKEAASYDLSSFEKAFTEAEDLVRRKGLGIHIEPDDDEDYELVCNKEEKDAVTEQDREPPLEVNVEEPVDLRRSTRTKKQSSKYNHDILSYIREAKPILREILEERRSCERHKIFTKGTVKERNSLKTKSGFGPISQSENEIVELLQDFHNEFSNHKEDMSQVTYIMEVWLPEAIIYAIQKIDHIDYKKAELIYLKGTSQVSSNTLRELQQQMKGKTLTEEERNSLMERAKRFLNL